MLNNSEIKYGHITFISGLININLHPFENAI